MSAKDTAATTQGEGIVIIVDDDDDDEGDAGGDSDIEEICFTKMEGSSMTHTTRDVEFISQRNPKRETIESEAAHTSSSTEDVVLVGQKTVLDSNTFYSHYHYSHYPNSKQTCAKCFCFVCDVVVSECQLWDHHFTACDVTAWRNLRKSTLGEKRRGMIQTTFVTNQPN